MSPEAFASDLVQGTYLSSADTPQASCKINTVYENHYRKFHVFPRTEKVTDEDCSLTYVGDGWLLTAAHCFYDHMVVPEQPIECSDGEKSKISEIHVHPVFGIQLNAAGAYDLALVKIPQNLKLKPMLLPASEEEEKRLLERDDCVLAGWGIDNDGKVGTLHAVKAPPTGVSYRFLYSSGDNRLQPGDSGGTQACRNENGDWVLLGVNNSISEFKKSQVKRPQLSMSTRVVVNLDWILPMMAGNEPNLFQAKANADAVAAQQLFKEANQCASQLLSASDQASVLSQLKSGSQAFNSLLQNPNLDATGVRALGIIATWMDTTNIFCQIYSKP